MSNQIIGILLVLAWLVPIAGCGSSAPQPGGGATAQRYQAALRITNHDERARQLLQVASAQHKAKDAAGAKRSVTDATAAAKQVADPIGRSSVYTLLASTQAWLGNRYEAKQALRTAREAVGQIEETESKARALAAVAEVQGYRLKNAGEAADLLRDAEKLVADLEDASGKASVLSLVAKTYARIDKASEADRTFDAALEAAGSIEDPLRRSDALTDAAAAQIDAQRTDAAIDTLTQAAESARQIENPFGQALKLADIAEQLSKAGRAADAHRLLDEADKVTDGISDVGLKGQAMDRVRSLMGSLPKK